MIPLQKINKNLNKSTRVICSLERKDIGMKKPNSQKKQRNFYQK